MLIHRNFIYISMSLSSNSHTKLFFLVLSTFSHDYFFKKIQAGAKCAERTTKNSTQLHEKKPQQNAKP